MRASPKPLKPLTIGIDARAAAEEPAGRGRLVRELLRELANRDDEHRYRLYAREPWGDLDARFTWVTVPHREPLWHFIAARRASRECDVFLASDSYLTVWFSSVPTATIVYDLVAFNRSLHPKLRSALIERATMGLAIRRSAAFVAISKATATDLLARYPDAAGRVTVALLGTSGALTPDASLAPELGRDAVLAVGTLEPRKNLPRLVAAYNRLPDALQRAHPLTVVGASGWQAGETMRALDSLGDRAQVLGYLSDSELAELYRRCAVFCYPSLYEGFGLPVLEAMAAGAAVVTSNVSSLPEVGGAAVEYADPRDVESIAAALRRVLEDPAHRKDLRRRGIRRAKTFAWSDFAATTLAVLETAARAPRSAPL